MPAKKPLTTKDLMLQHHLTNLDGLPIPKAAKDRIAGILKANQGEGEGEGLDFALKHISKPRLAIVTETAKQMHAVGRTVTARGRASLEKISDEEWARLVEDSNK